MSNTMKRQSVQAIKVLSYSLLFSIGLFLSGCEDFFIPPKNEFPGSGVKKSTLSLELVTNGAYGPIGRYHSSDFMIISELLGGQSLIYQETGSRNQNYVNFRNFDLSPSTGLTNSAWKDCYRSVNNANVVIEIIGNVEEPIDEFYESQRDRLLGEALFIRALGHFDLVRLFGTQYSEATKDNMGIIIRKKSSTGENFGRRGTVEEAYTQIIEDLLAAIPLLPIKYNSDQHGNFPSYRFRANRKAASALLAKVYFQMNEMDKALEQINLTIGGAPGKILAVSNITGTVAPVLERGSRYPNIFSARSKDLPVKEVLFHFNNAEPSNDYTSSLRKSIFNNSQAYFEGIFHYSMPILSDLYNYSDAHGRFVDSLDVRYTNFVGMVTQGATSQDSLWHSGKFGYINDNDPLEKATFLVIPVIRSAELLLMRAEILALQGDLAGALLDYNAVITRAGLTAISSAIPYTDLMSRILVERHKELDMEGEVFYHWKRMGAYSNQAQYSGVKYGYQPFDRNGTLYSWNSPQILAKIPELEMNSNPEISGQQNP
jgi:starch-binding outer membrane protein, SusD/RagB family